MAAEVNEILVTRLTIEKMLISPDEGFDEEISAPNSFNVPPLIQQKKVERVLD